MAKLLVAVSLLFGGTAAMGIYGGEKNGCGEPCAERPLLLCSEGLDHYYVAQVESQADGTKITNTGTNSADGPVDILARPPRPPASEGSRRRLPRAQVFSATADITVEAPGKALITVRDPRPLRPPARKRRNSKRRILLEAASPSSATART